MRYINSYSFVEVLLDLEFPNTMEVQAKKKMSSQKKALSIISHWETLG